MKETNEERKKRWLATAMGVLYCVVQWANLYVCFVQFIEYQRVGYFICLMIIYTLDKVISFYVLKKERFGYEILILDMLNLGFVSVFLQRYPPSYRPMYGTKLFFIIIPTVMFQLIFFFGMDMIDHTDERNTQVLMFVTYAGYQILQVRCFLALRMESNKNVMDNLEMIAIYTLNIFSNYGIWLVFASHRDAIFDVSLISYGIVLFILMVLYQSYNLYRLKSGTLLMNFLYNIATSTNYTTEYGYYFHHYNNHFGDLLRERSNDLFVMSAYKLAQIAIYVGFAASKDIQDKYLIIDWVSDIMLGLTALDILSNGVQYFFGARKVYCKIEDPSLTEQTAIAKAILNVERTRKFIFVKQSNQGDGENIGGEVEGRMDTRLLLGGRDSAISFEMQSISSSMDRKELVVKKGLDDDLARRFLQHLTRLQSEMGCVLVEKPKLAISCNKFEVSKYVSYAQITRFYCLEEIVPPKTFDLHADWELVNKYRVFHRGITIKSNSIDELLQVARLEFLSIYLPLFVQSRTGNKYKSIFQRTAADLLKQ